MGAPSLSETMVQTQEVQTQGSNSKSSSSKQFNAVPRERWLSDRQGRPTERCLQNIALHLRRVRRREQLFNFGCVVSFLHVWVIDLQLAPQTFNFGQHRVATTEASIEEIAGLADPGDLRLHFLRGRFHLLGLAGRELGGAP
jgi:hypothetical protein